MDSIAVKAQQHVDLRVLVQARMNSRRFPGKVLVQLAGRPMIAHVLERCAAAFGKPAVILLTSREPADDPVAEHATQTGFAVFRGDLNDVARRFQQCLSAYPCDWFVRISGDSPLIDPDLIRRVAASRPATCDLVTNVQVRSFPAGQSVEVVRAARFSEIDTRMLSDEEREHVTLAYYRRPERFSIINLRSSDARLGVLRLAVDTPEDLARIEQVIRSGQVPEFAAAVAQEAA
jgi:spore coat polysaccharide biosynthesis protein SpsF